MTSVVQTAMSEMQIQGAPMEKKYTLGTTSPHFLLAPRAYMHPYMPLHNLGTLPILNLTTIFREYYRLSATIPRPLSVPTLLYFH
jgi:hypothetical protein